MRVPGNGRRVLTPRIIPGGGAGFKGVACLMAGEQNEGVIRRFPTYARMLLKALTTPLVLFLVFAGNVIMFLCTFLFYQAEVGRNPSIDHYADALWWAMATVTTVGYGDLVPVTPGGRIIAAALMITGNFFYLSFGAVLVSILFSQEREDILKEERQISRVLRTESQVLLSELQAIRGLIEQMRKQGPPGTDRPG